MTDRPLRLKLALTSALVSALVLLVVAIFSVKALERAALAEMDASLVKGARDIFDGIAARKEPLDWRDEPKVREFFSFTRSVHSMVVEQPPGKVVYESRNLGRMTLPAGQDGVPYTTPWLGGELRVLQISGDGILIRLGGDLAALSGLTERLWVYFSVAVPLSALLIGGIAFIVSDRALRAVEQITAAAERISVQRLDERLPDPGTRDEIAHLTEVLNEMIMRLQASIGQSRRFSADASHELKTPLTIIRGEIETALRAGNLPQALERTMINLQEETGRLIHIVEGLLLLSQADAGKLKLSEGMVDFSMLASDITEDMEILASERGIKVEVDYATRVVVRGDAQFLRQVLLNLFDNAIKYNEPNGRLRVRLSLEKGRAIFTISNTGTTIPVTESERVFDRFHRTEQSRARTRGGQGLGLSICREIVRAHQGEIVMMPESDGWTTFRVSLPIETATESTILRVEEQTRRAAYNR